MTIARSASEVLSQHVTLEVEGIDRMYLNLYVPILQRPQGVGHFWIHHRGHKFALREVGFQANRRLLDVQRISHDCWLGEEMFREIHRPVTAGEQRASALRFGDPRVFALYSVLVLFRLLPRGFTNRDLRQQVAVILGKEHTGGQMTYDLRRLRLHGLIERIPKTRRYRVTRLGFRAALLLTRAYSRLFRPAFSALPPDIEPPAPIPFGRALDRIDTVIQQAWEAQQIAA